MRGKDYYPEATTLQLDRKLGEWFAERGFVFKPQCVYSQIPSRSGGVAKHEIAKKPVVC